MKIFKFDPATGRRGEFIRHAKKASWTAESLEFLRSIGQDQPECVLPVGRNQDWCAHIDAGINGGPGSTSYRTDEWICFCLGEWVVGQGEGIWQWIVLPPVDASEAE